VENPFFYDRAKMFWMWNKKKYMWEIVDETDLMNMIEEALSFRGETISRTIKGDYLEAFKRVGRKITPKDAPKRWVQFKDKAISLRTGNIYSVTPDYFFCNPIPWDIGESEETPVLDKLFEEWVGKEYVKTLYEIIAYCCYGDYPIQLLFCLVGSGRNGKSCFLKILSNFLGTHNICSTELDSLVGINKSRFETFKLFKKLGCIMGETNFGRMSTSGMLKKLTGGDLVSYEKKGKDAFDANNYAKLLISTNSLPTCEDTSEGFYRRWVIIDFPNNFPEGKDIVESVPEGEYKNLACKVTKLLPKLLESGTITNQGTLDERREKYISASNPLTFFLDSCCTIHTDAYVSCNDLFGAYCRYLHLNKRRRVGRKEFYLVLSDEGYFHRRADKNGEKDYFFEGVMLNNDWEKCCKVNPTKTTKTTVVSNSIPYIENELENNVVCVENVGKIFIKCNFCGKDESNGYTASGKPVCSDCMKQLEVNGEKVY